MRACGLPFGARWDEVDGAAANWTVPPARMKAKLEHRVPLSSRAVAVLNEAREIADKSGLVFPSLTGRGLSDTTLSKLLRALAVGAAPHGFRSSRDWAAERTDVPREVCELAWAHVNSDRVEAAYRRSDLFERRRKLMAAWATYVSANGTQTDASGPCFCSVARGDAPSDCAGATADNRRDQSLVFPVLRRVRIVTVAVAVADSAVRPVDHHLAPFANRLLAGAVDRASLRAVPAASRTGAFSLRLPASVRVRSHMYAFAHLQFLGGCRRGSM